ncbi:unnamed protein product [Auanema sp. JU1783]|nr:unnamed protein product [Auanema sp. JU1783]
MHVLKLFQVVLVLILAVLVTNSMAQGYEEFMGPYDGLSSWGKRSDLGYEFPQFKGLRGMRGKRVYYNMKGLRGKRDV